MSGVYRRLGHMTCPTQAHLLMDIHLQEKGQNSAFYVENDIQKHTDASTFTVRVLFWRQRHQRVMCFFSHNPFLLSFSFFHWKCKVV